MVEPNTNKKGIYSLSFMYSYECNLSCDFCMYSASPEKREKIDLEALYRFIKTIDFNLISAVGLFGGEISINTDGYEKIIDMIPSDIPKFTITNGTWSLNLNKTIDFLRWAEKHELQIFISGTEEHKKHQDRVFLECLINKHFNIVLKPSDEKLLPMGRLFYKKVDCTRKCVSTNNKRITVTPEGWILLQSCDGKYPIIGNICENFFDIHDRLVKLNISTICPYYNKRR